MPYVCQVSGPSVTRLPHLLLVQSSLTAGVLLPLPLPPGVLVPLVILLGRPAALCQLPPGVPLHVVCLLPQGQEGPKELPGPPAEAPRELTSSAVM